MQTRGLTTLVALQIGARAQVTEGMRLFFGCVATLGLALLWSDPAAAMRPATPAGAAPALALQAQFKFPWESRAPKRKTRQKRPMRQNKARTERRAAPDRAKKTPAASARSLDPKDALLPALMVPLGALPRGATAREQENWASVAAQLGEPAPVPLLPPEGPAPAPANVMALLSLLQNPEPSAPVAEDVDEDETPDIHVPLPPVRPGGETVAVSPPPPRDGLAPEGQALAPEGVPVPSPRDEQRAALNPNIPLPPEAPEPPKGPTAPALPLPVISHEEDPACATLADESFAVAEQIPPIEGPGVCGGGPLVRLTGVRRKDGGLISIKPAATLRCAMAKELADYLRGDVSPSAEAAGAKLDKLTIAGSFQCRGRNGAAGGKMSEHGRANAVDLSGFGFADGKDFGIFAADLPEPVKTAAKSGACARFATVLGPGSDGFHETHLHIDLQPRRSKAKLCQWSDPEVAKAKEEEDKQDAETPKPASTKGDAPEKAENEKDEAKGGSSKGQAAARKTDSGEEPLPKRRETP